jgi:tetratricopeptide (TPR) repeat protein
MKLVRVAWVSAMAGWLDIAAAGNDGVPARDALVRRCLDDLHSERFDAALAVADELKRGWPSSPAGYLAAANVHQTRMRDYRVRTHEGAFRADLRQALDRAEQEVRTRPSGTAFFARGTALAYQAAHRFSSGDHLRGVLDAIHGVKDARRAASMDPSFADPTLLVALFDFWKAEKLGLGVGLFGGGRRTVVARLERVRTDARFLSVEAAYALQTVHYLQGDDERALAVNRWLLERFPTNVVALYQGGMILDRLGRAAESLAAWEALESRLLQAETPSHGFLAECLLRKSLLLQRAGRTAAAAAALERARAHAGARVGEREMEGPLVRFEDVARQIRSQRGTGR